MKEITLEFKGLKLDSNKAYLEDDSGIYCVYICAYNSIEKVYIIKKLLYIGEADSIRERLKSHEKHQTWENNLINGEQLGYTRALISGDDKLRAEAALIFHHKPPVNTDHKDHFGYPDTKMILKGNTGSLDKVFTVYDDR